MSSTPAIIETIQEAVYGGLPAEADLSNLVLPIVTLLKVATFLVAIAKYRSSSSQPFSRNAYIYGMIGAVAKLINFYANIDDTMTLQIFEDICFSTSLIGVIVTLSSDFLWALSSSIESDVLFKRNVSEVDFVGQLRIWQPIVILYLVFVRHLPVFAGNILAVHVNYAIGVVSACCEDDMILHTASRTLGF